MPLPREAMREREPDKVGRGTGTSSQSNPAGQGQSRPVKVYQTELRNGSQGRGRKCIIIDIARLNENPVSGLSRSIYIVNPFLGRIMNQSPTSTKSLPGHTIKRTAASLRLDL